MNRPRHRPLPVQRRIRGWPAGAVLVLWAGVLAMSLALGARAALADEPPFVAFSAGGFDVNDDQTAFEGRVEYRGDTKLWVFKPFGGGMFTSDGALYGYAGILLDVYFGRRVVTTLSFAPGLFHEGSGKDLGHVVEFRSQIELAWRFNDRSRLGLALSHMSNASLGDSNPGAESLVVTYAVPLNRIFGR